MADEDESGPQQDVEPEPEPDFDAFDIEYDEIRENENIGRLEKT